MNILLLGGYGYTGRLIARHLLETTNHQIFVAGRHLEKGQALVDRLNCPGVKAIQVDAADSAALANALRGMDLLLVASPTTHQAGTVVRCALDAQVDYLDIQLSDEKLRILKNHETEIQKSRLCFITEAGYHPGLPSAMIRYAAGQMDCIESAMTAGFINMGAGIPYTEAVDELMEIFLNYQAQVFKGGRWTKPGSYDTRKFDFGPGIGSRACYSMFFEELRDLPRIYPNLKNTGFYISGTGWVADAISMLAVVGLKLAPKRGMRPLGRLVWWSMTKLPRPPYRVILKVDAQGLKNNQPVHFQAQLEHPDGYELTAIPITALLMQYEQIRKPGLHLMGHIVQPERLFRDMESMGVCFTSKLN